MIQVGDADGIVPMLAWLGLEGPRHPLVIWAIRTKMVQSGRTSAQVGASDGPFHPEVT